MTEKYDFIAIGGGSGGLAAVQRAAEYGARCAVIESGRLGGTCVNVGCVPKKIMWHAAGFPEAMRLADEFGFTGELGAVDWQLLKRRRDAYVQRLNDIYAKNLSHKNVDLIAAEARLKNGGIIEAAGRQLHAAHIVIATGGYPIVPNLPGADLGFTSDDFFELIACPRRVAVIGSGYVAIELSGVMRSLGAEVHVFARKERVLRNFDPMLSKVLMERMSEHGIYVHTGMTPQGLQSVDGTIEARFEDDRAFSGFDAVLWAVGRAPCTAALNLVAAGVLTDADGFVPTDLYQNTNVAGFYAVGDVSGRDALTPVAIAAGRRLADRLFGDQPDRHLDYENIPTVIFTHPPIGTIGLTEPQARARYGDEIRVYESRFVPLLYSLSEHKPKTVMKLITLGEEEKIIGCHIIGEGADEMLQGFAVAIRMGARKVDFDDTVAIHPTSAEELVTMR